jgi:hypothetical protein
MVIPLWRPDALPLPSDLVYLTQFQWLTDKRALFPIPTVAVINLSKDLSLEPFASIVIYWQHRA